MAWLLSLNRPVALGTFQRRCDDYFTAVIISDYYDGI